MLLVSHGTMRQSCSALVGRWLSVSAAARGNHRVPKIHSSKFLSSSSVISTDDDDQHDEPTNNSIVTTKNPQRVWKAKKNSSSSKSSNHNNSTNKASAAAEDLWEYWKDPVLSQDVLKNTTENSSSSSGSIQELLDTLGQQESSGARLKQSQLGVLREDPSEDMRLLMEQYTVPSLASALRDREDVLQHCATLSQNQQWEELARILRPYQRRNVLQRRSEADNVLELREEGFTPHALEVLRKSLARMPRRVVHPHDKRAGVVVALCNVHATPCVVLEKRAQDLRAHPDEVCLPGGMVCHVSDPTITATCLREMREEIEGLPERETVVLGPLRINWGEVHHLVGVAVTPLVCYVGDLSEANLVPNPSEVSEVFTIPLASFMDRSKWIHREGLAPIFVGGPHPIWGLTGYILERFVKDILARYDIKWPEEEEEETLPDS